MTITTSTMTQPVKSTEFGPTHVIDSIIEHTHTAILLHGRGSNGPEFAEELFDETLFPDGSSLAQKLPSWKWVFPSSRVLWSEAFQEDMPAWFEAHSLTDITARQEVQIPGIKESTEYVKTIIDGEIEKLDGASERVVLGGISQGGAVAMWTLLNQGEKPFGAFFGTNTWLPFASSLQDSMSQGEEMSEDESVVFLAEMLGPPPNQGQMSKRSTRIFLGHGTDDAYVDVELGRQARDVLTKVGYSVEWKEYTGAELEGHWIKAPEELEDMLEF
ncbi:Alpha/Beta hydrolase protein, partial [Fusarium flagelliforme]